MFVVVIGGGWYGCMAALEASRRGHKVVLHEAGPQLLHRASKWNQNRLHLGFHYMRNKKTRDECQRGYYDFCRQYSSETIIDNIYAVPKTSWVDAGTIHVIASAEQIKTESIDVPYLSEIENAFRCEERLIDVSKNRRTLEKQLLEQGVELCYNSRVDPEKIQADMVIVCVNGQIPPRKTKVISEPCISLLYKAKAHPPFGALTLIDGPFFSIYPMHHETLGDCYTLTDVEYTPIASHVDPDIDAIRSKMEAKVKHFFPEFDHYFHPIGHFLETKIKPLCSKSDDRSHVIETHGHITHFFGGKITGALDGAAEIFDHTSPSNPKQ